MAQSRRGKKTLKVNLAGMSTTITLDMYLWAKKVLKNSNSFSEYNRDKAKRVLELAKDGNPTVELQEYLQKQKFVVFVDDLNAAGVSKRKRTRKRKSTLKKGERKKRNS